MKVNISRYFKNGKDRKIKIEIHPHDLYSMDHTLSLIILPMLKQLKETKHGSPNIDDKDVPENIRSTSAKPKENDWDTDEFHHDRWNYVLDEMIWAFEQIASDGEDHDQFYGKVFDKEGYANHSNRIDNGIRLFGSYFRDLWN